MQEKMKNIILVSLAIIITVSCVPPTKFKALQSENLSYREQRDMLRAENEKLSVENRELAARLERAEKILEKAGRDTIRWQDEANR